MLHYLSQENGVMINAELKDTDQEPVFCNGLPALYWKNMMQAYSAKGIISLAVGAGDTCKASMQLRKPCVGKCLSEAHVKALFDHLVDWTLTIMQDQNSAFYNQDYKNFISGLKPDDPTDVPKKALPENPRGGGKRKPSRSPSNNTTAKGKGKRIDKKKRRKSGKKKASSSEDESSSED